MLAYRILQVDTHFISLLLIRYIYYLKGDKYNNAANLRLKHFLRRGKRKYCICDLIKKNIYRPPFVMCEMLMVNRGEGGEFFHFLVFASMQNITGLMHIFFVLVLNFNRDIFVPCVCAYGWCDEIMNHDGDLTMCTQMNVVFHNQWTCLLCKWFNKRDFFFYLQSLCEVHLIHQNHSRPLSSINFKNTLKYEFIPY